MGTQAKLRRADVSAQKCRLVANQIRGLKVQLAMDVLSFSPKKSAKILRKLLESALANAEHNNGADIDDLLVKSIEVGEGMTLKRMSPRAKGRSNRLSKPTCHIVINVAES